MTKPATHLHCDIHMAAHDLAGLAQALSDMAHNSGAFPDLRRPTIIAAQQYAVAMRAQLAKVERAIAAATIGRDDDSDPLFAQPHGGHFGGH